MQCKSCGATLEQDSKFCSYCGAILSKEQIIENTSELMEITELFSIERRGTVVSGILNNDIHVGDLVRNKRTNITHRIMGIEVSRKMEKTANRNDLCGLLFATSKDEFKKGDVLILDN